MGSTKNAQATASSGSSKTIWPGRANQDGGDIVGEFTKLGDARGGKWGHHADVRAGKHQGLAAMDNVSLEELNPPAGGIRVKNEVVVTTESWEYKDRVF